MRIPDVGETVTVNVVMRTYAYRGPATVVEVRGPEGNIITARLEEREGKPCVGIALSEIVEERAEPLSKVLSTIRSGPAAG